MSVVTLCKRKLHGGVAVWQAYDLGEDADGRWLFTPAGSMFRRVDARGTYSECEVEGGGGPGLDSLILVPDPSQHWLATWSVPERALHISLEICTWAVRDDDLIVFMDWELDPFRMRDGTVGVEDVDELDAALAEGRLSRVDATEARAAVDRAVQALTTSAPPFDGRADVRLASAGRRGLPPLVDVPHPSIQLSSPDG